MSASAHNPAPVPAPTPANRSTQTRLRILQTATHLFARKGFSGVSVDEIVSAAGVNKRMVYHYFGNKSGLYTAALEAAYDRLANVETEIFVDEPSVEVAVERLVYAYFGFLQNHPDFVDLILWENLGRHLPALPASLTKAPILQALGRVIERGIASRQIRPGLDPQHMLIHLIGICMIYFSNRHTLSQTVGLDLQNPAILQEGIRQAISLVKHGFCQPPDQ
ncbi:MAG TPA: TetR/AcrR family transcriptional regulator [Chthoniobacteraceae bacterium]|nr:TetR/AcrR family transcriptional regulator [Chthoniobacteraceae bacterium]